MPVRVFEVSVMTEVVLSDGLRFKTESTTRSTEQDQSDQYPRKRPDDMRKWWKTFAKLLAFMQGDT
jgi:hypothetical protein